MEPSIQFTVEMESEGKLPFLDVLLQRDPDRSIATTVYRKSTHTDRYLDFASRHPLAHKIAVVWTLYSRAEAIRSSVPDRDKEMWHLRQALITNTNTNTNTDFTSSALAEDAWSCHPPVVWGDTRILDHNHNLHQNLNLESAHIRSQPKPLNRENGSMPPVYHSLF